jgi:hypothetical protein
MRMKIILVIVCLSTLNCHDDRNGHFYDLLSDNFLTIVDTIGYRTGKLIQIPHDSNNIVHLGGICILVDTVLQSPSALYQSILTSLKDENQSQFEYLIAERYERDVQQLDLDYIRNTGRFILVSPNSIKKAECGVVAGRLTLYKPYVDGDRAILTVSVSDGEKAGFTNCFLFFRKGNVWAVHKKYELERW